MALDIFAALWLLGAVIGFGMIMGMLYHGNKEGGEGEVGFLEGLLFVLLFSLFSWVGIGLAVSTFMCEVEMSLQKLSGRDQK